MKAAEAFAWRQPEWWSLAIAATAWVLMIRAHASGHAHHVPALTSWILMTLAMMLPMVIDPIRTAAKRSLWRRRHRAMVAFLIGYVGCWILLGLVVLQIPHGKWAAAIAFVVAAVWQFTRAKRRALIACHRTMPLAPRGWRADRDCVRYGILTASSCIVSCWALMLACALSGHALLVTVGATAIGLTERYAPRYMAFR